MHTHLKKKIIKLKDILINFVRKHTAQLVIIGGTFGFLEIIKSFPYINIIPSYQYYVIGFTVILTVFIFGLLIPSRNIIKTIMGFFVIAAVIAIFDVEIVENLIGFIVYLLLFFVVVREIVKRQKDFRDTGNI